MMEVISGPVRFVTLPPASGSAPGCRTDTGTATAPTPTPLPSAASVRQHPLFLNFGQTIGTATIYSSFI